MYLTKYLVTYGLDTERTLLVNTLSGALDIFENRHLPLLENPGRLSDHPELMTALRSRGYLFDDAEGEAGLLQDLYRKFTAGGRPKMYIVCPTHACNLRCRYCFEHNLVAESSKVMTRVEIDSVFRAIHAIDPTNSYLKLFGGEPLLPATRRAVSYILERARGGKMDVEVVTNGTNVTGFAGLLSEYRDILSSFQITVDGPKPVHDERRRYAGGRGSFDRVVAAIDWLLKAGLRVRLRVNVDAHNIDTLPALGDFIQAKGWARQDIFQAVLAPVTDHKGRARSPDFLTEDQLADRVLRLQDSSEAIKLFSFQLFRTLDHVMNVVYPGKQTWPRFHFCEANNLDCYVFGADGFIYACSEALGNQSLAIGRFHPDFELFPDRVAQWDGRGILTLAKCRDCRLATLCGGGCAYAAIVQNGASSEPVCDGVEETLRAYLRQISQRLLSDFPVRVGS